MEQKANDGRLLFIGISALILFGLLALYSASIVVAAKKGTPSYYFLRQSGYAAAGYVLMILLMFCDYHRWLRLRMILFLASLGVAGLMCVYIQSPVIKGARRGLRLGDLISIQPSEIAKLIVLFYLAYFLGKNHPGMKRPGLKLLPCIAFTGAFAGLIAYEPDLGQALCICFVATVLFFVAGLDWRYISAVIVSAVPVCYFLVWEVPFRRLRILAWLTALLNPLAADYQTRQAAIAVGRGGFFGVGFGESRQKFLFLPEAVGDFIYAVISEELGFIGAILVAAAFLALLYFGMKIAIRAPDPGGFYLGFGISLMLTLQAFINISTSLAIVPTKGLTLPFISQGGSSLVTSMMSMGILLNISTQRKNQERDDLEVPNLRGCYEPNASHMT